MSEQYIETRITVSFGVNRDYRYIGRGSPEQLQRRVEQDIQGSVQLDKVEYRVVTLGDWEEEAK